MPRMYHSPSHSSRLAGGPHLVGQQAVFRGVFVAAEVLAPPRRTRAAPSGAGTTPWRFRRRRDSGSRSSRRAGPCRCRSGRPARRKNRARASGARRPWPRPRRRTGPPRRTARRSPVSFTYSQTDTTSHSASSEQTSARPWMMLLRSGVGRDRGRFEFGAFCFSGSNQSGSNRCSP